MTVSMMSSQLSVKYRCQDQQELVLDVISTLDPDSTVTQNLVEGDLGAGAADLQHLKLIC